MRLTTLLYAKAIGAQTWICQIVISQLRLPVPIDIGLPLQRQVHRCERKIHECVKVFSQCCDREINSAIQRSSEKYSPGTNFGSSAVKCRLFELFEVIANVCMEKRIVDQYFSQVFNSKYDVVDGLCWLDCNLHGGCVARQFDWAGFGNFHDCRRHSVSFFHLRLLDWVGNWYGGWQTKFNRAVSRRRSLGFN